ncbi:hypothetical protein [Saccharicrinis aurantiacus]|uniref:hypothetical protein n=1 Tax=Saccharicrinis aurantiacus TaxID=1849719 RepID=UPI0008388661|nr:hypothetical protein [Saccharicrinis aurantiacus]
MKFKAGILPFVIAISMIVALICSAFFLVVYYSNIRTVQYKRDLNVINNLNSLENLVLSEGGLYSYDITSNFDLWGRGSDSVSVLRERWGGFELFKLCAYTNSSITRSSLLVANKTTVYNGKALFVSNRSGQSLSLVGNTEVIGDVLIPRQGLVSGFINGRSFIGNTFVKGNIDYSNGTIPTVSQEVVDYFKRLRLISTDVEIINYNQINTRSISNPFIGKTEYYYSMDPIVIDKKIMGNIIIISDSEIILTSYANTDNVIFVAPQIRVKSNFRGNFQAFSTHQIIIENDVILDYPTLLFCNAIEGSQVRIGYNTVLKGGIYQQDFMGEQNDVSASIIIDQATIMGQVLTSGSAEVYGNIYGQLICEKVVYKDSNEKFYENYLVDCEINRTLLSDDFLFPIVLMDQSKDTQLLRRVF